MHTKGLGTLIKSGWGRLWVVISTVWVFCIGAYIASITPNESEVSADIASAHDPLIQRTIKNRKDSLAHCLTEHPLETGRFFSCLEANRIKESFAEEEYLRNQKFTQVNKQLEGRLREARLKSLIYFLGLATIVPLILMIIGVSIGWIAKGFTGN